MLERHGIPSEHAEEALADDTRVAFEPDYASRSGQSVPVTVIVVIDEHGKERGGSAWPSNRRDVTYYSGNMEGDVDEQDQ